MRAGLSKGYAAKTATLSMTYLLAIMRTAYHAGRIPRDVTIGARPQRHATPDEHKVPPDEIPTRAEVTAIWSAAPPRFPPRSHCGPSPTIISGQHIDAANDTVAWPR